MAQLIRIVVDAVVTDDEDTPNSYRLAELAKETSDNLHVTIAETTDGLNMSVEKLHLVHIHDSVDQPCQFCANLAYDEKNGNVVMRESGVVA